MIAKVDSACLVGMDVFRVQVEISLAKGLPSFSVVGLPDASVREARDRVVAAIRNTGFEFPSRRVTVNLSPTSLPKEGPFFDLAIAIGILMASDAIQPKRWPRCVWVGELALDGAIQPVRGALAIARSLASRGDMDLVLPQANLDEVSMLDSIGLFPFGQLRDVVAWLQAETEPVPLERSEKIWQPAPTICKVDLAEIKGQALAKRALEVAAAGRHNLLMMGSPGTGKTLLAQALSSILPAWSLEEALDATQIHSIAGTLPMGGLLSGRPFRSPHHTVSSAALIGGGEVPMPGEASLAHRGVLFLDELPEFRRDTLEAMRQPIEEGQVHIHRMRGRAVFPAEFLLIAAMNPCPCGYRGHPKKECVCSPSRVQRYLSKVSGPLLDRVDLQVEVPALRIDELMAETSLAESSVSVRQRVEKAWRIQQERLAHKIPSRRFNSFLHGKELKVFCELDAESRRLLQTAVERLGLSARAFDRIRRVTRTIADLEGSETVLSRHVGEAIQYRGLDRPPVAY